MATAIIMIGNPIFKKSPNDSLYPFLCNIPLTITLDEAPTILPFPPKHAPKANDHHKAVVSIPVICPIFTINGIIVATNGILSKKAEAMAATHKINSDVIITLPPVRLINPLANTSRTPTVSSAPTITNNPIKKKMVGNSTSSNTSSTSTLLINKRIPAPNKAIVAD